MIYMTAMVTNLVIGEQEELVGRKGNLGEILHSVKVYFLLFQFLLFPYMVITNIRTIFVITMSIKITMMTNKTMITKGGPQNVFLEKVGHLAQPADPTPLPVSWAA